jgi:AcrR family transcriptional regulator
MAEALIAKNGRATAGSTNGAPLADVVSVPQTDTASRRREQIVQAAREIIAREGIHRLTLGHLEKQVDMARGHLTYYFRTKEDILLAVFDRMLADMQAEVIAEAESSGGPRPMTGRMAEALDHMFGFHLADRPGHKDFLSLVWTFLAQMNHRPDFRNRMAGANGEWRSMLAADYALSVPEPVADPRAVAPVLMALLTGLDSQLAVDPEAFDRKAVGALCRQLLAPLFPQRTDPPTKDGVS